MHEKSVLMCFNIPRGIKEDCLYELFCIAGPIESIQPGKSGKSVFICYEFRESVDTAKEIFKDLKLYGRPIRMFDKGDIENIHAKQEEESNLKRPHETDDYNYNEPPTKFRRYEEPRPLFNNQPYYQSAEIPQYQERHSRRYDHQNFARSQKVNPRHQNHFSTFDSNMIHAERSAPKNDLTYRSDLIPNNHEHTAQTDDSSYSSNPISNNQQRRREEFRGLDDFRNPYEMPVSRYNNKNSHRYGDYRNKNYDSPYNHERHQNHGKYRSSSSAHFSKNEHHNSGRHRGFSHRDRRH